MKKRCLFISMLLTITTAVMAQDASEEIKSLWTGQIQPIIDVVLMVAVGIAGLWLLIQFFQGKKEALKQLGYVIGGAVVFRVISGIVGGIVNKDMAFLVPGDVSDVLQVFLA
ncbi:MAG: hypothetical protein LBR79_06840 [Oscillospiraceae bacterium]|jgi:hypothetical protein|nr:hypothetical protein [Oscillospiraceae bacterium]